MMARPTDHPTAEELRAFCQGHADPAAADTVAAHLAGCLECQKTVADFPAGAPETFAGVVPELAEHPDYELQRKLGEGTMGSVYLARNKLMDRLEVLKVVNRALLGRPGALDRFLQEIRSAARLQHANVVTAYAALRLGDVVVLAMEYVEGKNLHELVLKRGPQPVIHACYYARQVAKGLQHAYEHGTVHRDIKPQNLVRGSKGDVKILDFGLAKVVREEEESGPGLTGTHLMMGTPHFVAPEQASDARSADIRADLYSLGCTLYYMLAGRPPFVEKTPMKVVLAHMQKPPEPITALRPDAPPELAAVLSRMLEKDPAARYQTPAEVVSALRPFVKGEIKALARPTPPPLPAPGAGKRKSGESTVKRRPHENAGSPKSRPTPSSPAGNDWREPARTQGGIRLGVIVLVAGLLLLLVIALLVALRRDSTGGKTDKSGDRRQEESRRPSDAGEKRPAGDDQQPTPNTPPPEAKKPPSQPEAALTVPWPVGAKCSCVALSREEFAAHEGTRFGRRGFSNALGPRTKT
jgi:serine/threonine protein kinase